MAAIPVPATFNVANPSAADLALVRAAHVIRIEQERQQAVASRRRAEIGMSGDMVDVGVYLAKHGLPMLETEAETWFAMGPVRYQRLVDAGFPCDTEDALLGGRWPLLRRQAQRLAA